MRYTLGLIFDDSIEHIYLIRKQRPEWQKGLLNGIGGKIEENETPLECMKRESLEETGYDGSWNELSILSGDDWVCYIFYSIINENNTIPTTLENEEVIKIKLSDLSKENTNLLLVKNVYDTILLVLNKINK